MTTGEPRIHQLADMGALFDAAAERILEIGNAALADHGTFHIALAGGNTPRGLYQRLASPELAGRLDWRRVAIWFGDERCVTPDHPDSNFHMVRESLLGRLPVPPGETHRMHGELPPAEAAEEYAAQIARHLPKGDGGEPRLDLILLGMGPDGHIASLFPGSTALTAPGTVASLFVEKFQSFRITLTFPVLNAARHLLLLVGGGNKAEAVRTALACPPGSGLLPVCLLQPTGEREWFLDAEAAALLAAGGS